MTGDDISAMSAEQLSVLLREAHIDNFHLRRARRVLDIAHRSFRQAKLSRGAAIGIVLKDAALGGAVDSAADRLAKTGTWSPRTARERILALVLAGDMPPPADPLS
jgi:hypothetical protein